MQWMNERLLTASDQAFVQKKLVQEMMLVT